MCVYRLGIIVQDLDVLGEIAFTLALIVLISVACNVRLSQPIR